MVAKNKSYEEFYEEEEKKTSFTRTKNEDEVFYEDDDEEFSTPPKEQQHGSYVQEAIVCVHTLVHRSKGAHARPPVEGRRRRRSSRENDI